MIDLDTILELVTELLDDQSIQFWGPFHWGAAVWHLGLEQRDESRQLDIARIESARAAKAQGLPLYQWAQDYKP